MNARFIVWALHDPHDSRHDRVPRAYAVCPSGNMPQNGAARATPISPLLPLAFAERTAAELTERAIRAMERRDGVSEPAFHGHVSEGGAADRARTGQRRRFSIWKAFREHHPVWRDRRLIRRLLTGCPEFDGVTLTWPPSLATAGPNTGEGQALPESPAEKSLVFATLEGRSLLSSEVGQALAEQGLLIQEPIDVYLDRWVQSGCIERVAAVGWDGTCSRGGWRCRRCLSEEIALVPCITCGSERCPQCSSCGSLGRSSGCVALYHRRAEDCAVEIAVTVRLPFALSPQQAAISKALRASGADAFIWAACGAGKTEVTYGAIEDVIRRGGRVLFAVPRRDVVQQLGERLETVFHGVDVVALHGGTPLKYARSPLVVATAHQAVRFRSYFDLLVIDEVDAFPLSRESWLKRALDRTLKAGGRKVLMTATPPERLQRIARTQGIATHVLPARPHGHPLPVPEVISWGKRGSDRLRTIHAFADRSLSQGRRIIVFVPTVQAGYDLFRRLAESDLGRVDYVHGSDRERSKKLSMAELGKIDVLVSTTVLERGVTIPKVDVAVVDADNERVFDSATLIQMAGRSGRKIEDPHGRVAFLAGRATPAIRWAVRTIQELNRIAAQAKEYDSGD